MVYRALSDYLRETYGEKLYKLALSGGMTCPNRDGSKGDRGCIFCSPCGGGEFAEAPLGTVAEQIERAKKRVLQKHKSGRFIAYFQNFTNTYAPVAYLRSLWEAAIAPDEIAVLSVATRPDCLPDEVVALLSELNRQKPVWVELGLQTIHASTANYIRRGYPLGVYDDAVRRLKQAGLSVIVHMIIGLPHETPEMIEATAFYIGKSGADGIKLQLLHITEGSDLAEEYKNGTVPVLSMEDYFYLLARCLRVLPPSMVIHRLTGDADKKTLIAPQWSADKKRVLNEMKKYFAEHNVVQGERFIK